MPASNQSLLPQPAESGIRRLSSATANVDGLDVGPLVVVPPEHLHKKSDAHETAASLEISKHRLAKLGTGDDTTTPEASPETTVTDIYAFAFDIDGVLIRGGKPIPEAIKAMKVLNGENEFGIKM